jgi:hypothetical protein
MIPGWRDWVIPWSWAGLRTPQTVVAWLLSEVTRAAQSEPVEPETDKTAPWAPIGTASRYERPISQPL